MIINFKNNSNDILTNQRTFYISSISSDIFDLLKIGDNKFYPQSNSSSINLENAISFIPPPVSIPFIDIDGSREGANEWGIFSDRKATIRDSLGENGDLVDYFRFSVNNRINADFFLTASHPSLELEILDSQGNFIARSQSIGDLSDGLIRVLGAGEYYLRVYTNSPFSKSEYNLTLNGVNLSQKIRSESNDVNLFRYDQNGRTDSNQNQANGGNFAGIEANQETVVVIHGWQNSDQSATIQDLLLEITKSDVQVLALDWSSIAQAQIDRGFVPIETAKWIAPVARWLQGQLEDIGINPNQLTIIGHSLGSYLGAETGSLFGQVKNLVALDPAAYPPNQVYDIDIENGGIQAPKSFRDVANKSIAFVVVDGLNKGTFGLLGNNDQAATADDSFLIKLEPGAKRSVGDIEAHGAVVYAFANILARSLLCLPDLDLPTYERNRYNNRGSQSSDLNRFNNRLQHEGIITVEWTGPNTDEDQNFWRVKKLVTVVDGSGREQEIWR